MPDEAHNETGEQMLYRVEWSDGVTSLEYKEMVISERAVIYICKQLGISMYEFYALDKETQESLALDAKNEALYRTRNREK